MSRQILGDAIIHLGKVAQWLKDAPEHPHGDPDSPVGNFYVSEVKVVWYGDGTVEEQGSFKPDDFGGFDFYPHEPPKS